MTERFDFFILVKWVLNVYCCRRNLSTSLYANSIIGVGMASTMYHISRGEARKYTRWGDYAMIAASTLCLSTAIKRECNFSRMLILSSAVAIPFQPLLVTALHTSLMEVFLSAFTIPQCAQFCSDSS
jgi:predicted membrane channel-forming protein YqfA (hemolysin III family)